MRVALFLFFVIARHSSVVIVACIRLRRYMHPYSNESHAASAQENASNDETTRLLGELEEPVAGVARWNAACQSGLQIRQYGESRAQGLMEDDCSHLEAPKYGCPGGLSLFCYEDKAKPDWCCCSLNDLGGPSLATENCAKGHSVEAKAQGGYNADTIRSIFLNLPHQETWDTLEDLWKAQPSCKDPYPGLPGSLAENAPIAYAGSLKQPLLDGYELQKGLYALGIPAAFSSYSILGMFRQAWNAAVYTLRELSTSTYEPLPGDFKFPFIPRLQSVRQVQTLKKALERDTATQGQTLLQQTLESEQLISASPRIDDCIYGESFLGYYVSRRQSQSSAATKVVLEDFKGLINNSMVPEALRFLRVNHSWAERKKQKHHSWAERKKQKQIEKDLLDLWWEVSSDFEGFPETWCSVMTVFAAYGDADQVGRNLYSSYSFGAPQFPNRSDERRSLLDMEVSGTVLIATAAHQFRIRPYSAEEIVDAQVRPSDGVNGLVGFRFSTLDQREYWDTIYDRMVKLAKK